jgi:Spx/MgsR family transcriptional regulator
MKAAKSVTIYGIPNCDTMKKARTWLADHDIDAVFHDYRKAGIDAKRLTAWCRELGWEKVLNRAGTTFRKLDESQREGINQQRAIALMLEQPGMIKRPVLDVDGRLLLGFKPETYAAFFGTR